jgi:hypothetical protein
MCLYRTHARCLSSVVHTACLIWEMLAAINLNTVYSWVASVIFSQQQELCAQARQTDDLKTRRKPKMLFYILTDGLCT